MAVAIGEKSAASDAVMTTNFFWVTVKTLNSSPAVTVLRNSSAAVSVGEASSSRAASDSAACLGT